MKELDFLKAMDAISDAFLIEAEQTDKNRRSRHSFGRRGALLIAALLVLALSVSAAYVAVHWNQIFTDHFAPTDAQMQAAASSVQQVSAIASCAGVQLRVSQSLGDRSILYLDLEIVLPDTLSLWDYVEKNETDGTYYATIWPEEVQLYRGSAGYEQLRGMDEGEIAAWFGTGREAASMVSVESAAADPQRNTLHFLVGFVGADSAVMHGEVSLVIGRLENLAASGEETLLEGPYVISWQAKNDGEIRSFAFYDGARQVGCAQLSQFALRVCLEDAEGEPERYAQWLERVLLQREDGSMLSPGGSCVISYTSTPGELELSWQFDEILPLGQITALQVADYRCEEMSLGS